MTFRRTVVAGVAALCLFSGCGDGGHDAAAGAGSGPGISGVLREKSGATLDHAEVMACMATTCLFGSTDARGRFSFTVDPPAGGVAEVAIKTREDPSADPPRGSALCPVRVDGSSRVDVGNVYVPALAHGTSLGTAEKDPQVLGAGAGVELGLRRADLVANGHALSDIAAAAIPKDQIPAMVRVAGEKVVAAFGLHPFGVTSRSPMSLKAPLSLPDGAAVNIRTISDIDGRLSPVVPGHVGGGFVTTDAGTGITQLTWVVVSVA